MAKRVARLSVRVVGLGIPSSAGPPPSTSPDAGKRVFALLSATLPLLASPGWASAESVPAAGDAKARSVVGHGVRVSG